MRTERPRDSLLARLDRMDAQLAEVLRTAGTGTRAIRDQVGAALLEPDPSGVGLARPWVSTAWSPTRVVDWPSTVSATPETIFTAVVVKQHPLVAFAINQQAGAGTTGWIRVLVGGVQLVNDIPVTTTQVRSPLGPLPVPGDHMAEVVIEVQAWRTTGSGAVSVWCEPVQHRGN